MKRIQNFLAILTVGLIGCSGIGLIISALGAAIGAETIMVLSGYIGFYAALAMLATGSIMTAVIVLDSGQKYFQHPIL